MIAVYVRRESDAKARYLADVPFDALDTVIPTLQAWGVEDTEHDDAADGMYGQFVVGSTAAYFEVVIT
jgi:hypothetical protein